LGGEGVGGVFWGEMLGTEHRFLPTVSLASTAANEPLLTALFRYTGFSIVGARGTARKSALLDSVVQPTNSSRALLLCNWSMLCCGTAVFRCFMDKEMASFGYARVSTRDQDLAGQIAELQAAGCGNIFKEKVSGAKTDRPEGAKVMRGVEPGDVLVVPRLDRLARSTRDLLNIIDAIGKAGAGFRSLHDAWADTTTPHGKLMVTVLGGLAEFEREL